MKDQQKEECKNQQQKKDCFNLVMDKKWHVKDYQTMYNIMYAKLEKLIEKERIHNE